MSKQKPLSIGTTFNYNIPLKRQLHMIESSGFTHFSIGGGEPEHSGYLTKKGRKKINVLKNQAGLQICSIHAPFDHMTDMSSPEDV